MMSLFVWLFGPMFLLRGGVSVSGPMFLPGESLSWGFLSRGRSLSRGGLCPGGLCPVGLCPVGSLFGDLCPGESLSRGVSVRETPPYDEEQ